MPILGEGIIKGRVGGGEVPPSQISSTGTGTLVGGTVTVSDASAVADSIIMLTPTSTSLAGIYVSAIVPGVSFTVTSPDPLDTASFNYVVINS